MLAGLLAIVLATAPAADAGRDVFAAPSGPIAEAIAFLKTAVAATSDQEARVLAAQVAKLLPVESPAGERLNRALATSEAVKADKPQADDSRGTFRAELTSLHELLAFEPLREAPLPKDFPTYTPAGAIEVKTYPKNRRAVANEFFTLFAHITGEQIAMTAPVRMEFKHAEDGELEQQSMAFYFGDPTTGSAGEHGPVTTLDDAGEMVVALGHRGDMNEKTIEDAERRLRRWLQSHPEYEAAGDLIVLGYNSPMAPANSRFMEVQIPIRKADRAADRTQSTP